MYTVFYCTKISVINVPIIIRTHHTYKKPIKFLCYVFVLIRILLFNLKYVKRLIGVSIYTSQYTLNDTYIRNLFYYDNISASNSFYLLCFCAKLSNGIFIAYLYINPQSVIAQISIMNCPMVVSLRLRYDTYSQIFNWLVTIVTTI